MDDQRTYREDWGSITPTRFSVKQLLLSVTLISVGLGELVFVHSPIFGEFIGHRDLFTYFATELVLVAIGSALIGAGMFIPFGRGAKGALFGGLMGVAYLVLLLAINLTHPAIHMGKPRIRLVQLGMTIDQVEKLLGKPLSVMNMPSLPDQQIRIYQGDGNHEIPIWFKNGLADSIEDKELPGSWPPI